MDSQQIRKKFLDFFREKGHALVPSSSLIPDDPSVLLTTAGMQQFKKYYTNPEMAERDFGARNTVSVQKSFRTSDIDEVGDETHLTFFEMLGNFSFGYKPGDSGSPKGGYFKEKAIKYAYEFITSPEWMNLKIDYVSVFEGDGKVPADKESEEIWRSLGISDIRKFGRKDNFWGPTGAEGPCGPTTEIYINGIEIWNIVFNEYYCSSSLSLSSLPFPGVDTGMGLERLAMVSQNAPTIFETDLFSPLVSDIPFGIPNKATRLVADHMRGVAFLLTDGVRPSNKEAGYVLRRLARRSIAHANQLGMDLQVILKAVVEKYKNFYPELNGDVIQKEFGQEREKFEKTLKIGYREFKKMERINAAAAFKLYETYGLPFEILKDFGGKRVEHLSREDFDEEFKKHQEISRAGAEKKFGGHGFLLDTGELKAKDETELKTVTRLHTATHLLQAALRKVLGNEVQQAGSDITAERTRFDFTFPRKLTSEEIKKVEALVNEVVEKDLPVGFVPMPIEQAKKIGALHFFREKYPAEVKVYYVGRSLEDAFSKEFCGGPHVSHTLEVGEFKTIKEEAVGAGIRRIRAAVL